MLARRSLAAVLTVSLVACRETTAPDPRFIPTGADAVSTTTLTGSVGGTVQPAPSVRVRNSAGDPIPDVPVTFAASEGGGTVQGASTRTDVQGIATVGSWTLGTTPGANTLTASVAGVITVRFSASAAPGPPVSLTLVSGDGQNDTTRAALAPIVFRVSDAYGNAVPGATVEALIAEDAGTIDPAIPVSDADGRTQLRWTLGTTAGAQTARAQLRGLPGSAVLLHATTRWPQVYGRSFASGYFHSCAVLENGRLFCWGRNSAGQIGDGTTVDRSIGVPVGEGIAFSQVVAGSDHTCALTTAAQTLCWGFNHWGQLGDGTMADRSTPEPVRGAPPFAELASNGDYVCGRTPAGEVYCWGFMVGTTWTGPPAPTLVSGASHFRSIAAGGNRLCGVDDTDTTQCFKGVSTGRVVNGLDVFEWRPAPLPQAPRLVALAGSLLAMCGITDAGAAYCWGTNRLGELGNGTADSSATPVEVAGGHLFRSIHAGYDFTCGISLVGEIYCWGNNLWGSFGFDVVGSGATPFPARMPLPAGLEFKAVAGGFYHTCGVTTTKSIQCWGAGMDGQLGDGLNGQMVQFYHRATPAPALRH